jgi:hypothetical protein
MVEQILNQKKNGTSMAEDLESKFVTLVEATERMEKWSNDIRYSSFSLVTSRRGQKWS